MRERERENEREKERMRERDNRGNIYLQLKIINCHSIDIRAIQTIWEGIYNIFILSACFV